MTYLTHSARDSEVYISADHLRKLEVSEFAIFLPDDPADEARYRSVAISYGKRSNKIFRTSAGPLAKIDYEPHHPWYAPRYLVVTRVK